VSSVPLTDLTNLHLDSAERPKLPLHASTPETPARSTMFRSLLFLIGIGLATAVAAFLLLR
jgi:hypothetical protein